MSVWIATANSGHLSHGRTININKNGNSNHNLQFSIIYDYLISLIENSIITKPSSTTSRPSIPDNTHEPYDGSNENLESTSTTEDYISEPHPIIPTDKPYCKHCPVRPTVGWLTLPSIDNSLNKNRNSNLDSNKADENVSQSSLNNIRPVKKALPDIQQ